MWRDEIVASALKTKVLNDILSGRDGWSYCNGLWQHKSGWKTSSGGVYFDNFYLTRGDTLDLGTVSMSSILRYLTGESQENIGIKVGVALVYGDYGKDYTERFVSGDLNDIGSIMDVLEDDDHSVMFAKMRSAYMWKELREIDISRCEPEGLYKVCWSEGALSKECDIDHLNETVDAFCLRVSSRYPEIALRLYLNGIKCKSNSGLVNVSISESGAYANITTSDSPRTIELKNASYDRLLAILEDRDEEVNDIIRRDDMTRCNYSI